MREIKFRGITNELSSPMWVYGDLIYNSADVPLIMDDYRDCCESVAWTVDSSTVGEYTGKKDVNKKEIFEDDVVWFLDDRAHERIGVIKWHEKMCCWVIDYGEAGRDFLAFYACEIRGNIHDNPELLR